MDKKDWILFGGIGVGVVLFDAGLKTLADINADKKQAEDKEWINTSIAPIYEDVNNDGTIDKIVTTRRIDDTGLFKKRLEQQDTLYAFDCGNKTLYIPAEAFRKYNK